MLDRLEDKNLIYSGHFAPPEAISDYVTKLLVLSGRLVGYPIVTSDPISSAYQEKISLPFLYAAWDRLLANGRIRDDIILNQNTYLATAPTGEIYPLVLHESVHKQHAIVFDASLLYFYIAFGNALAALGEQLGKAKKIDSIALGSLNIIRTANPSDLNSNEDCFRGFKEALVNMLTTGSLYTRARVQPNSLSGQELVARMIDDVYTFLLAHELRHIGMYGKESFSGTVAEWTTEFDADGWALSVTVSSSSVQNDTLSVYVSVSVAYLVMSLIYRTIHLMKFGTDYGQLPNDLMFHIYFPKATSHLHPATRLMQLRKVTRDVVKPLPSQLDEYDSAIDAFFETLWKPLAVSIMTSESEQCPLDIWDEIVGFHQAAYDEWRTGKT